MDKFNLLYNELACNFGVGTEPFRGPFKAALDAYIEERVNAMVEHCPIRLPDTPVKPVEGKNAAVSTEGNTFTVTHPDLMRASTSTAKTIPLPVVSLSDAHAMSLDDMYAKVKGNTLGEFMVGRIMGLNMQLEKLKAAVPLPVVGRCKDCKHWKQLADTNQRGQCDFASLEKMDVYPEDGSSLIITRLNFGCVHFEAKGGT